MSSAPLLSIVIPVCNDDATIAATVESCLRQTLTDLEVVCVDDASDDATVEIIERFRARDARVRLIRHDENRSAFQARRTGIAAARGAHVLFVDGDDELVADAVTRVHAHAVQTGADITGFGVTVVDAHGGTGGTYERRLQPPARDLVGVDVLAGLFPIGRPAQGQLWRFLFRTAVLRAAAALVDDDLVLPRVNDLPLLFLAAASATSYSAIPDRLYRYHFGRGGSGHRVDSVARAEFYASAIVSIDSIRSAVERLTPECPDPALLAETYESARLSIIGYVCSQLVSLSSDGMRGDVLAHLFTVASAEDVIDAAARFYPATLATLQSHVPWRGLPDRPVRSVLLSTSAIRTGGISAVVFSQARYLRAAGFDVTVVARDPGTDTELLPDDLRFVQIPEGPLDARLQAWADVCRSLAVDLVIDHQLLYTTLWPQFALVARASGAATIGWVHNSFARPIFEGTDRGDVIVESSNTLAHLVVLSPLDVAYFRLRGVSHTSYLPNPPTPLLLSAPDDVAERPAPGNPLRLVWIGRLEERTKQVTELIEVASHLRDIGVEARITVVGPDWDITADAFNAIAKQRRLADHVVAVGVQRGDELRATLDASDAFISTSIIEGYQLTLAEAQSRGLPVFMYELPWLLLTRDNGGIVTAAQGDAAGLARRIADAAADPEAWRRLSRAGIEAARRATTYDFAELYRGLVTGTLPSEFSPEPTVEDAADVLRLSSFFTARARGPRTRLRPSGDTGSRLWKRAAPAGRALLRSIPGLRPLAHRAKRWLGAD